MINDTGVGQEKKQVIKESCTIKTNPKAAVLVVNESSPGCHQPIPKTLLQQFYHSFPTIPILAMEH